MKNNMVCIVCPRGCTLIVEKKKKNIEVKGNGCNRGKEYAISEITDPKRILTTTLLIKNASISVIPVVTSSPISKNAIKRIMDDLNSIVVEAPIKCGQVIVENIQNTGANIVASCDVERIS